MALREAWQDIIALGRSRRQGTSLSHWNAFYFSLSDAGQAKHLKGRIRSLFNVNAEFFCPKLEEANLNILTT